MSVSRAPCLPLLARDPDAVLFRDEGGALTARQFLERARLLAERLPEAPHLVNLCQDRARFTLTLAAAVLRGQVVLLSSDVSPDRLRGLADRFGNVASIADDAAIPSPLLHMLFPVLPDAPAGAGFAVPAIPSDRVAAIVFTSGSTGEPVGTAKSWCVLATRSIAGGARFGMAEDAPAAIVGTVPARHMYGFETTALLPLHAAASSWSAPVFYPSDVRAALCAVPPPRVLVTTPLQLRALLQSGLDLPPLARVISATAPLDPEMAAAAEARWRTETWEIFGATELGSIASRRTIAGDVWTTYDGVRLDGSPLRVLAPPAPPGVLADTVEVVDPAHFRLLGRGTDLVKLGGRRASLAGLNRILTAIPGVADGVFVAPDDLDRRPTARLQAFVDRTGALGGGHPRRAARPDRPGVPAAPRRAARSAATQRDRQAAARRAGGAAGASRGGGLSALAPVGRFRIPADHPCLAGHFPGRPLVPGVLALDAALALVIARQPGRRIAGIVAAKFLHPILPDQEVEVRSGQPEGDRIGFECVAADAVALRGAALLGREA